MEKIFSKRNIKIFNWMAIIINLIIFEFGYCNVKFTTDLVTRQPIQGFYFSLCRGITYLGILIAIFFINRSKIIDDVSESFKSKTKKTVMILYVLLAIVAIAIYAYKFLVKQDLALIHFALISVSLITGFMSVEMLTKKYYTNLISIFMIGMIFCFTVNVYHILDEKRHFMSAYNLSYGNLDVENPVVDKQFMEEIPRGTHYSIFVSLFGEKYEFQNGNLPEEYLVDSMPTSYNAVIYIPSTLGILVGRILQGSVADVFFMGRIFNLATYIALIALALKILPYKKNTFFIILTIPMFLCFASTYSVDGIGVGLASLFIAYFLKLYNDKENITLKNIIVLLCLYTLLLMFKSMSYIFVGLIMFLLPLKDIIKKYKKQIPVILIAFIIVNLLILYLQPKINLTDNRYENVNATEQIKNAIHNPLIILSVIKNQVKNCLLNFTWLQMFNSNLYFAQNSSNIFVVMFLYYFYVAVRDDSKNFNKKEKIVFLTAFMLTFCFTSGILYIACAPVGTNYVLGYQPRYIFPIISLIMICASSKMLKTQEDNEIVLKISSMQLAFIIVNLIGSILR